MADETVAETKERLFPERRTKFEVWVDLDPIPGSFHTAESARNGIHRILNGSIPHYNPSVSVAKQTLIPDVQELLRDLLEAVPDSKETYDRVTTMLERLED